MRYLASLTLLLALGCAQPRGSGGQMWALYVRALKNQSTAPNYVLITLVDKRTGSSRVACTEAPFLLGAIHQEHELAYDENGERKAMSLALTQQDRTFTFSNPRAIKNVQPRYTEKQLEEMRGAVQECSDHELRRGLTPEDTDLQRKLFGTNRERSYGAYRDAVAHLLLERGLLPRRGCIAGWLTVDN